jgi:hypothetical protein
MPAALVLLLAWGRLGPWRWVAGAGMLLLGGNVHDLWGRAMSQRLDALSLVAVGALLLIAALVRGRAARAL